MTIELFKDNSYIKAFEANIVNTIKKDAYYHVVLDQTAFYPEGGGQPCDIGTINQSKVLDVYRASDEIFHVLDAMPEDTHTLNCKIDWSRRYDLMQQHTGQHLLSSVIEKLYDGETIGFHLSDHYTTIDVDKNLSVNDLENIELEMNRIIYENKAIKIHYPDDHTLKAMPLRKQPKVTENIRIIEIDGYDFSACGGTHLLTLGEIGMIKITNFEKYKSGLRLEFVCGERAVLDYMKKNIIINTIAKTLASKPLELLMKFEQSQVIQNDMRKEIKTLKSKLLDIEFNKVKSAPITHGSATIYMKIFEDGDFGALRKIAATLSADDNSVCIFGLIENGKANIILTRSKNLIALNIKDIFATIIDQVDGKGGGNITSAQGGGPKLEGLQSALDLAFEIVASHL